MRKSALTFTFFALALVAGSRALPTAAAAPTNISSALSQLQLNANLQRASDAAKTKAGFALAAAEQVPATAVVVGNDALSSVLGAGYPSGLPQYQGCIKSAFEYAQAFDNKQVRCVSPCLFGRFPDTSSDPIWKAGSPLPPKNASDFMKGEKVALAFMFPSRNLEAILAISANSTGLSTTEFTAKVLSGVGISATDLELDSGDNIPFKIFGDDCSLFERTATQVQVSYPTFPDAFDRITRTFKLNPKIFGDETLRPLQTAYSYNHANPLAQFRQVTDCNVNVSGYGTDAPDCKSAIQNGTNSIPAGSGAKCAEYVAALQAFCTPQATPNYDTPSCISTLKTLAAKNVATDEAGQIGAVGARAMFAACFDFLAPFNTDNSMVFDTESQTLGGREYLVTGNGLLKQAGGYFIKWLTV